MHQDTVYRLAGVQFMSLADSGRPLDVPGLVTIQLREVTLVLTIGDIVRILNPAQQIPQTEWRWLVNSWIDLRRFNKIY